MKHPQSIIQRLTVTEKGSRLSEAENKYLFKVHPGSNKNEIKGAVEQLFKVKVTKVNTLNRDGKTKRDRRGKMGTTSSWKRAIVTLKDGDKIELT